jgi:hypothetical protein
MNHLLLFCQDSLDQELSEQRRGFRMFVERIGNTVHLIRRQNSPLETLPHKIYGYGHAFPAAYTAWTAGVGECKSHQRIIRYDLGGLQVMMRFEGDGYANDELAGTDPVTTRTARFKSDIGSRIGGTDEDMIGELIAKMDSSALLVPVGGKRNNGSRSNKPNGGDHAAKEKEDQAATSAQKLGLRSGGVVVPQDKVFEIRTRTIRKKDIDIVGEELPRLWLRQLGLFVLAFHHQGTFRPDNVNLLHVGGRVKEWEKANQAVIKRFLALLKEIMALVSDEDKFPDGRMEIVANTEEGRLDVRRQTDDAERPLSVRLPRSGRSGCFCRICKAHEEREHVPIMFLIETLSKPEYTRSVMPCMLQLHLP